ncbi:hypothetical protein ACI65C_003582 [Semiaphis heraclei]
MIPKLPKHLDELHLALINLAFSTTKNLKFLSECKPFYRYIDGTFKSRPKLFYQSSVIHGAKNTTYTPLTSNNIIHSAVSDIFPDVIRKGCRFHLGQSIWRKIQSWSVCNLTTIKPNDERVDNFFNYFEKNYISMESKFQPEILEEFSNSEYHQRMWIISLEINGCFIRRILTLTEFENKKITRLEFVQKFTIRYT